MATSKLLACFLMALIVISIFQSTVMASNRKGGHHAHGGHHRNGNRNGTLNSSQCPSECTRRCSQTQYHKACMFFCQKCCAKCLCVPPGFYGHKDVCPCYNNWKTKEGGPKCP